MNKTMRKKIIAYIMCLVLLVPYVSNVASAADPATPSPSISEQGTIGKQTFEAVDTTREVGFNFTANYPGSNVPTVTWKSNDTTVVEIQTPSTDGDVIVYDVSDPAVIKSQKYNSKATLAPKGAGKTTVTATIALTGAQEKEVQFEVVVKPKITSLTDSAGITVEPMIPDTKNYKLQSKDKKSYIINSNANPASNVTWRSTRTNVASVVAGATAALNLNGAGTTVISAEVDGNIDKMNIEVPLEINDDEDMVKMVVGNKTTLRTNVNGATISWNSSNNLVATVDSKGTVTAVNASVTPIKITATVAGGIISENQLTDEIEIYVVDDLAISKSEVTINRYYSEAPVTFELEALATDSSADISWGVADSTVAEITPTSSNKCIIKGLKEGTTTVTVSQIVKGVKKEATCLVHVNEPVKEVKVKGPTDSAQKKVILHTKEGYQLFADVIGYPDGVGGNMTPTNKAITWVSSDESVVKVSQYQGEASKGGAVTTVGPGYATVMAITEDGQKLDSFNFIIREKVTSVTLPYTSLDVNQESERIQLVATVSPDYPTTERGIVWTSSDPTVAEVDKFGVVSFKKPGYTSIKATSTDNIEASATCMINVRIPVTGVTVDKTEAKMKVGETLRIIAEVSPANAANKNVTWSSTDTSVVTVSDTGLCTAKAGGSATIVVRTQDGGFVATCMITVYQEVESIRLSKTTARVGRGSTIRLRATVLPETATNKKVTWSSSDNSIATVNQDGEVTGLKIGDPVIITATTVSGNKMATCKVTVTEPVTGLIISPTSKTLKKGQYFTIKATVYPTDRVTNDTVLWASSNPKVAKVDSKGKVTAVAGGKATIQAKTEDQGFLGFCTVTVIEKVSKITLNHKSAYLSKGQKLTLKATVSNSTATNKKVVWTSSNKKVATVNSKGQVVAKGNGTTTIKVKATDGSGKYATCTIRVITRTTSVRLNQYYMTCIKGRSYRLTAKVYPTNASIKKIKWTSSNPKVARVSQSGIVTAVGKGTCKITATNLAPGNKRATCNVTVINPIPTTAITLNKDEITLVKGGTTKITARKIPANTTEATKWMSNNPEVARVNQVGVVTGIRPGKTTIVAYTASGMEATCAVEIVAINRTSLTLEAYDRYTMYVDGAEEGVLWSSSNPSVATINATTGAVFAVKAGTTVLTATYKGCKMTCVLRVRDVS